MFWYKPRLINGIVICQTHILDIDMNRNYHLSDSYISHGHESKGGGHTFILPLERGVGIFLAPGEGGVKILSGSSRKIADPPTP